MKNDNITIYYAGNELLEDDSMPFEILPKLKDKFPDISFIHHDPSENLKPEKLLIIIDTAINTDKVVLIRKAEMLEQHDLYSPHDWDLAFNLKLLIRLGEIDDFVIIALPPRGDIDKIFGDVVVEIEKLI